MDKSPDAFRTISEVSELLDTPAHVLRFWESRFSQIRPVKRAGGRRYYRPSDVALLAGIKRLLHDDGLTIRGVLQILRDQGVRHVAALAGAAVLADSLAELDGADHAALAAFSTPTANDPTDIDAEEAGFIDVETDADAMPPAMAAMPVQSVLPLFGDDPALETVMPPVKPAADLPPLVLSRRPSRREDTTLARLIRAVPTGAFVSHAAELGGIARRLRALRGEMLGRAEGGQG